MREEQENRPMTKSEELNALADQKLWPSVHPEPNSGG